METTTLRPILSDDDHAAALREIDRLIDAAPGTPERDRLEVLSTLVWAYEETHHRIAPPDPIDAIRVRMDELGMTFGDLARIIGSKSHASEVLNRQRPLSLAMIRALAPALGLPAEVLIAEPAPPARKGAAGARAGR